MKNNIFLKLESFLTKLEELFLSFFTLSMIFLGAIQVIIRNLFNTGFTWGDSLVRALVLWVGFIGASIATRRGKYISIDIVSKLIKTKKIKKIKDFIVNLISLSLVVILFYHSIKFTLMEYETGITTFFNLPTYIVFLIVPISFLIIIFRLLIELMTFKKIEKEEEN
jgi:TRAP-type C4-dicarboxylate transport system permease small subunit